MTMAAQSTKPRKLLATNYVKVKGAARPGGFFPFNGSEPRALQEAVIAARAVQPEGVLAVYQAPSPVVMVSTLRCIGHAPVFSTSFSELGEWTCANCGQRGTGSR